MKNSIAGRHSDFSFEHFQFGIKLEIEQLNPRGLIAMVDRRSTWGSGVSPALGEHRLYEVKVYGAILMDR